MSLNVTFNGAMYIIPETGEVGWGGNTTSYLVAIAAGALQKTGGSFTLSSELDFGASFGIMSLYYKSRNSNVATSGILRLNNNSDSVSWRNFANSGNLPLTVDASDRLSYNGSPVLTGTGPSAYVSSITGTANQVIASSPTGAVTLSLPQSINSTAAVQFGTLALGSAIVASAMLSLTSTSLGFLPPRMTTAQRDAIATPATGLIIYNTTTNQLNGYDSVSWVPFAQSGGGTINSGVAGFFSYYPATGTTLDDQTVLSTNGTTQIYVAAGGSAAAPTLSFASNNNSGFYRIGTDNIGLSVAGTLAMEWDGTNTYVDRGQLRLPNGTASLPSLSFNNDPDTGFYRDAANEMKVSFGGSVRYVWDGGQFKGPDGTSSLPSFSFTSEPDSGMYVSGTNEVAFVGGATVAFYATTSGFITDLAIRLRGVTNQIILGTGNTVTITSPAPAASRILTIPDPGANASFVMTAGTQTITGTISFNATTSMSGILNSDGTAAVPSYSFTSDTNTGMYWVSADKLGLVAGGNVIAKAELNAGVAQMLFGSGSSTAPAICIANNNTHGFYRVSGLDQTGSSVPIAMQLGLQASSPTYTFDGDSDTGMYRVAANRIALRAGGSDYVDVLSTGADLQLQDGSAGTPAIRFAADTNTGIYRNATDSLRLVAGGTIVATAVLSGTSVAQFVVGSGTSTEPSLCIAGNQSHGFYRVAGLDVTGSSVPIAVPFSTAAAPGFTFAGDENTGIYRSAADTLDITTSGSSSFTVDGTNGVISSKFTHRFIDGSAATPSLSFTNDTNTGLYRSGADVLNFSTGGTSRMQIETTELSMTFGGAQAFKVDANATAGNTRMLVYDVDNGTIERVSVGAADSGGAGFKVLRIPN